VLSPVLVPGSPVLGSGGSPVLVPLVVPTVAPAVVVGESESEALPAVVVGASPVLPVAALVEPSVTGPAAVVPSLCPAEAEARVPSSPQAPRSVSESVRT
jgi:hypothetical protein